MAKICKAEHCKNKVWSNLYCSVHQYLRTDDKWKKQTAYKKRSVTESKARSKGNFNEATDSAYDFTFIYDSVKAFDEASKSLSDKHKKVKWIPSTKKKRSSIVGLKTKAKKDYKKVYRLFFDYSEDDYVMCEARGCDNRAVEIHHIDNKGMGGSNEKDFVENLVGLCRECHNKAHDNRIFNNNVRIIHLENVIKRIKE